MMKTLEVEDFATIVAVHHHFQDVECVLMELIIGIYAIVNSVL
ncbi:MAG: hypothetical protein R8N23_03535 [Reichenbachiella sp.]|nr:hypothetical protein [Reichenbachiella sp.]MDW3208910.1 hypothetical protein [Reichenbachiella sp.]